MSFAGIDGPVEKAKGRLPAGAMSRDVADIVNALAGALERNKRDRLNPSSTGFAGVPLPRPEEWRRNEFGPDFPLPPELLDPARRDTGQPDPRLNEYPVSINVQIGKDRHVQWETLKKASETPLFRACIELRKTELRSQEWQIRVSPTAAAKMAKAQDQYTEAVALDLQKKYQDDIDRLTSWWEVPDRKNGRNFSEWIALALDEQLTHDALAIYPWQTYGGNLLGLWILDGTTVKPLLDETGGRPSGDAPAFQQLLYGFPRGEFTAQTYARDDGVEVTPGAMTAGQLIYRRRNPRTGTPYGYSATEQALLDGLLYNRRFGWMLAEYTEGTLPATFMESDGQLDWTPTQLLDYERDFNMTLAGQTAERMRARFLPPGFRAANMSQTGERYKPDYDLHLVKLVCMHFGTTITELGFTETGGLGSTGYHEGQEDINYRKGRLPDLKWFAELLTEISRTYLGMPDVLEFTFLGLDSEDESAADALDHARLADGRMTLNQAVTKLGLPPLPYKEANMNMVQTARGVVYLEGSSEQVPPGTMIEPASEQNDIDPATGKPSPVKPGNNTRPKTAVKPAAKDIGEAVDDVTKDVWDELNAYWRWLPKHHEGKRNFRFEHLTEDVAKGLGFELLHAEFVKASGADPKVTMYWPLDGPAGSAISDWSPYGDRG